MRTLIGFMVLIVLCGCAASIPPMPAYSTSEGEACAADCQKTYGRCMENEIRPDYLIFSPRKEACGKMLRGCYESCAEKEKQ